MIAANPRLEQARSQAAVMRGPIVYCLESIDLPAAVNIDQVFHPPRRRLGNASTNPICWAV